MKARQFQKLCAKAKDLLIAMGWNADDFSIDDEYVTNRGRDSWASVWGHNTGPDYYGECDWFDAWFRLCEQVTTDTANWKIDGDDPACSPYDTSVRGTRNVLRHARLMIEERNKARAGGDA